MFRISSITFFGSLSNVNPLECVSIKNQECKGRPDIININSKDPVFFSFSIKTNRCSGSCKNIIDTYVNTISRTNETRHIKWHETCKCNCSLDPTVCNTKQRWNEGKCRCKCKELIDKCVCNKGFIWNPSNFECECDKSFDIGEYLHYSNCKCREKLFDQLIEECNENIDVVKINNENENENKYSSCIFYIVLFSIIFVINIGIGIYVVYSHFKKDIPRVTFNTRTQTTI